MFTLFQPKKTPYDIEQTQDKLLHLVQFRKSTSVEQLLTEMKRVGTPCDLTITNSSGDSLVGIAADNNDMQTLKVLLQHGASHIIRNKISGCLPILSAKFNQNKAMIAALENPQQFLAQFCSDATSDVKVGQELSKVIPGIAAR